MKFIELNKGFKAIVDDDDFEFINQNKWSIMWSKGAKSYYAQRVTSRKEKPIKLELMHRKILKATKGQVVDHINGDTLDNRKSNIRLVDYRQNNQNRHKESSSIFPGVSWFTRDKIWRSAIRINGKYIYLGGFKTELEAYIAYVKACQENGFSIDFMLERFPIPKEINTTVWTPEQILRNEA